MSFDWKWYSGPDDAPAAHKNRLAILDLKEQVEALSSSDGMKIAEFRGWLEGRESEMTREPYGDRGRLLEELKDKFMEIFGPA